MSRVAHCRTCTPLGTLTATLSTMGISGRFKLTKSTSLNLEYYHLLTPFQSREIKNNLTIGFDIETGGHVFQLVFSNTRAMTENLFIVGSREGTSTGSWGNGDIHFGFNLHRTFNVINKKRKIKD